ncbi:MAG: WecB/TagA/CpsF family glycosyltransferase [Synoicihabitans sp.]
MTENAPLGIPKTVVLLGVPFHDVTMAETLAHIDAMIAEGSTRYLATANLDFAAQASQDVELQRILLEAHLVLCDGTPLIWASRWLQAPIRERVAGSDLMPELTAHCAQHGYRMFLLGATDETLELASAKMMEAHPTLQIAGAYAPPIAKLLDFDNEEILRRVHAAKPDVLIVCFGCPKQEKWIYMNQPKLGVPVSIGLGATLDFVAGNFSRAPVWMRKAGLEWVFRLSQEPRRLFNRYWFDLVFFVASLRRQRRQLRHEASARKTASAVVDPPSDSAPSWGADDQPMLVITWEGRCDAAKVEAQSLATPPTDDTSPLVLLETTKVDYLDSTALGLILRIYREVKATQRELCLLAPSPAVKGLFEAMKLDRLVPSISSLKEVRSRFDKTSHTPAQVSSPLVVRVEGDITAARVPELRPWIKQQWDAQDSSRTLILDFNQVNFIDSSGIGLMVETKRLAESRAASSFKIQGINENIRNVLKVSRMTEFFGLENTEGNK